MTELDDEWGPVKAEYEAAKEALYALKDEAETRDHLGSSAWATAKRRFDRASDAVSQVRQYWREVGVLAPDDHPGSRPSHGGFGVVTIDNVTEA